MTGRDDIRTRQNHLDMWKHYDDLRLSKNNAFTTANSVLVAITGLLLFREAVELIIVGISLIGILICASWFLLLVRNTTYIEYHRTKAGGGNKRFWTPKFGPISSKLSSKFLTQVPSFAFLLFWVSGLVLSLIDLLSGP
jgi:hypothetical protein